MMKQVFSIVFLLYCITVSTGFGFGFGFGRVKKQAEPEYIGGSVEAALDGPEAEEVVNFMVKYFNNWCKLNKPWESYTDDVVMNVGGIHIDGIDHMKHAINQLALMGYHCDMYYTITDVELDENAWMEMAVVKAVIDEHNMSLTEPPEVDTEAEQKLMELEQKVEDNIVRFDATFKLRRATSDDEWKIYSSAGDLIPVPKN